MSLTPMSSGNASFSVGKFCELLGPAAAQGLVKLDDGEELVELGLGQRILGREKLLLGFQDFVVTGFARNVALGGNRDRFLVRGHRARLLDTDALATSWKAPSAACWYWSLASCRSALDCWYCPYKRPP